MYRNSFRLTNREIDEAFASGQIALAYQPKLDMATGAVVGVECFARWHHPAFGTIPPALFLPVFDRQGRNEELTRFVLGTAIRDAARWRGPRAGWTVSINVSPGELAGGSLPVSIRLALEAHGLDPARLVIDLPERGLAQAPEKAAATIRALRAIGTGLALECAPEPLLYADPKICADPQSGRDPAPHGATRDVPTRDEPARNEPAENGPARDGEASAPLDPRAFTELKIGGTAMMRFASRIEAAGLGMVPRRLAFARTHAMRATAVGAETAETLLSLRRLGFERVQGNAICPPVPLDALEGFDGPSRLQDLFATLETPPPAPAPPVSATPGRAPARVRIVRGKARVELQTLEDEGVHGRRCVVRLSAERAQAPAGRPEAAAGPRGFLARLARALAGPGAGRRA